MDISIFDEVIDRKNTGSYKWDPYYLKKIFGKKDLLPLWVADMDFRAPQPVINALVERAKHGIFGYTGPDPEKYNNSVINWHKRRYDWLIDEDWIVFSPGIVQACTYLIQRFTKPGDKVIIQEPVYHPFAALIKNNGRRIVSNQLDLVDGHYKMNYEGLEKIVKDSRTKTLILCSPHNPVGRVWTREELIKLGDICLENDVLVISDEIHCDLVYPKYKHTIFASISEELAQHSITCTAGSKTFNLAGFQHSNVIIPNERLRETFKAQMENHALTIPNVFGALALQVAYDEGEEWLNTLMQVLTRNLNFLKDFIKNRVPKVSVIEPEGTYLVWLDFRKYELEPKDLEKKMLEEAKIALDSGYIFGSGGEGFERINIACPLSILKESLERIAKVFAEGNNVQ
ncbi:MAG: pyridoxal phosphate-dependent aminotransferase [Candidatus Heimdallarchaeota archaeon]|nr:MAG: pyridoxal phosphate-dependent aminotransferase [Candidatus Heimdallarchaeota archaeon]